MLSAIVNATILRPQVVNGTIYTPSDDDLKMCGADDCPWNNHTNVNLEKPDDALVNIILREHIILKDATKSVLCRLNLNRNVPSIFIEFHRMHGAHTDVGGFGGGCTCAIAGAP